MQNQLPQINLHGLLGLKEERIFSLEVVIESLQQEIAKRDEIIKKLETELKGLESPPQAIDNTMNYCQNDIHEIDIME